MQSMRPQMQGYEKILILNGLIDMKKTIMSLYENIKPRLPDYNIELLSLENWDKYAEVFYSNNDYYMITDRRPATKDVCIDTIKYCPNGFPKEKCYCIGFSLNGEAAAILSVLEDYPDSGTLYIGLFLINKKFKQRGIGTKIIGTLTDEAFLVRYGTVKLSVQDNNISGFSFWKKLGFYVSDKTPCSGFCNLSMEYRSHKSTE